MRALIGRRFDLWAERREDGYGSRVEIPRLRIDSFSVILCHP